jgi:hypothetical protein
MNNPLYNAEVNGTGKKVRVYRREAGGWVNYEDPKILYSDNEIIVDKSRKQHH